MKYVAPEFISKTGKASVIFIYCILTLVCIHGCLSLKTYFSLDLYITPEWPNYNYKYTKNELMQKGVSPFYYVYTPDKDFYEEIP